MNERKENPLILLSDIFTTTGKANTIIKKFQKNCEKKGFIVPSQLFVDSLNASNFKEFKNHRFILTGFENGDYHIAVKKLYVDKEELRDLINTLSDKIDDLENTEKMIFEKSLKQARFNMTHEKFIERLEMLSHSFRINSELDYTTVHRDNEVIVIINGETYPIKDLSDLQEFAINNSIDSQTKQEIIDIIVYNG